jgi:phosphate transport system protein
MRPGHEREEAHPDHREEAAVTDYRKGLHDNLATMRGHVMTMAAMVGEMVSRATAALLDSDLVEAQAIIDHDDELDALSMDIEEECFRLLALQSPVATDLRTIVASMKINSDVERSADLMVNVAKAARRMYGSDIPPRIRGILTQMGEEASRMLRLAMDAYAEENAALGAALNDIDDRLDRLQAEFVQAIFEAHGSSQINLQAAVQLAVIARYYERVGDHAVNIGERVWFMATGALPEHHGAARVRARRAGMQAGPDGPPPNGGA